LLGFRVSSRLPASPDAVWSRVATPEGINDELGPWIRMTVPEGADLRQGTIGRSWILLGGVLPVDYDDIHIEWLEPARGFHERSRMASASAWWHDRTLIPLPGGGCRVVDHIRFTPRVAAFGGWQAFTFQAMFRWRHRRLRARFGSLA
jgi:ligand-binding SRPBCC domain-containing protein